MGRLSGLLAQFLQLTLQVLDPASQGFDFLMCMWQGYNLVGNIGAFTAPRLAIGAWREVVTFYPANTALIASSGDLVALLPGPQRSRESRGILRWKTH